MNKNWSYEAPHYEEMYKKSIDPATWEEFWMNEAKKVHWFKFPSQILDMEH